MDKTRNQVIDFLRGIIIIDMMLVHYSDYFNFIGNIPISKLINYSDIAIEGFILLSGYMVGNHYFDKFRQNRASVIRRLLSRAATIFAIHYLMIITISLPLAIIVGTAETKSLPLADYAIKSFLFLNQVPLLHILPTFIPLFLLVIPILYLLEKGQDFLVLAISVIFFTIGNYYPHLFSPGDKTIFPVILWQIYFVIGITIGKNLFIKKDKLPINILPCFMLALAIFITSLIIFYGHHFYTAVADIRTEYGIVVRKFPLNYWGLFYHGSILLMVSCLTVMFWKHITRFKTATGIITLFGRHSLFAFIIHVYFAKSLVITNYLFGNPAPLPQVIIFANFLVAIAVLKNIEARRSTPEVTFQKISEA